MLIFDFSRIGWKSAIKEFLLSLVKTMVASAVVYIGVKLNNVNVSDFVKPEYAGVGIILVGFVRAAITSIGKWATTTDQLPSGTPIGEIA